MLVPVWAVLLVVAPASLAAVGRLRTLGGQGSRPGLEVSWRALVTPAIGRSAHWCATPTSAVTVIPWPERLLFLDVLTSELGGVGRLLPPPLPNTSPFDELAISVTVPLNLRSL